METETNLGNRVEAVSIETKGLEVTYGRPYVYVVKNAGPLDISKRLVANGKN